PSWSTRTWALAPGRQPAFTAAVERTMSNWALTVVALDGLGATPMTPTDATARAAIPGATFRRTFPRMTNSLLGGGSTTHSRRQPGVPPDPELSSRCARHSPRDR